jgi:hypothetical protein
MTWAISQEQIAINDGKIKRNLMESTNLKKIPLPLDEEIAPHINDDSKNSFIKV